MLLVTAWHVFLKLMFAAMSMRLLPKSSHNCWASESISTLSSMNLSQEMVTAHPLKNLIEELGDRE